MSSLQEKKIRVYVKKSDQGSKEAVSTAFQKFVKVCFGNEAIGTPCKKPSDVDYTIQEASRKRKLFQTLTERASISNMA